MKINSKCKMALAIFIISISAISCQKEKELQNSINCSSDKVADVKPAIKEFEIQPSWFKTGNLKADIIGDTYNNFGVGYDILTNEDRISIFNPGQSIAPLVSTTKEEKTDIVYCSTSDYSQIDDQVSSTLAASLKVSTFWVKANSSLSISKSERITKSNSSIYVNVLYIKKYGRGMLQHTSPNTNNYLTYKTGLNSPNGKDEITIDNVLFRKTYGDKFRSAITFGVMLVGTIQIVNVDFTKSTKEEIEAKAKISVRNMVEAKASWESEKSTDQAFSNSSIVVTATAIPRTSSYIFNRDDMVRELGYMDKCYAANDFGVIANEYTSFSTLYPSYNFINVDEIFYKTKSEPFFMNATNSWPGKWLTESERHVFCHLLPQEFDPKTIKPIYAHFMRNRYCLIGDNNAFSHIPPDGHFKVLLGYVFREKTYPSLVPLYWNQETSNNYQATHYADNNYNPNNPYHFLIGWVFPK